MLHRTAAVLLLLAATAGCGGQDCDDLPALRAERDAAREAYAELVESGTASEDETAVADDRLHDLDARVFDAEEQCADR